MPDQNLTLFDCGNAAAPRAVGAFDLKNDGKARIRGLRLPGTPEQFDSLLGLFTKGHDEAPLSPNSDETYFLNDSAPSGWGARFVARHLTKAHQTVPNCPVEWMAQSSGHGSGRIVTCAANSGVPELTKIRAHYSDFSHGLLDAFLRFVESPGQELDQDSLTLLRPGCDLGGVRPKALITFEGSEHIVKFGLSHDQFDVPIAEYATLRLAHLTGITVTSFELVEIGSRSALVTERFDRTDTGGRIHYLSAYSLLQPPAVRVDDTLYTTKYSYGGLAEALEPDSGGCSRTGHEIFRRMVFNIMVGNIDDHLRNHAVLIREPGVLELSPAFDLCPHIEAPFRSQSIGVGALGRASTIKNALSQCSRFHLTRQEAITTVEQIKDVLTTWRQTFREAGTSAEHIRRLVPCFAVADEPSAIAVNIRFEQG